MRDHAADRLLRPRSRDREDGKNRERLLRHCAAFKELPAVALVFNAGGNGLRRVDGVGLPVAVRTRHAVDGRDGGGDARLLAADGV